MIVKFCSIFLLFICSSLVLVAGPKSKKPPNRQSVVKENFSKLPQGLKEALENAYTYNPDLRQIRQEKISAHEKAAQAKGGWRPQLSLKSDVSADGASRSGTAKTRNNPQRYSGWNGQAGLELTQNLYHGGKTEAEIEYYDDSIRAGWAQAYSREQETLGEVGGCYFEIEAFISELKVLKAYESTMQQALEFAKGRVEAGEDTISQISEAEAKLADAKAQMASVELQMEERKVLYKKLTGKDFLHEKGNMLMQELLPCKGKSLDVEKIISIAKKESPFLSEASYEVQAARAKIALEGADLGLKVDVKASSKRTTESSDMRQGYRNQGQGETSFTNGAHSTENRILLEASIPLYEGGIVRSKKREAHALYVAKKLENAAKMNKLCSEIRKQDAIYGLSGKLKEAYAKQVAANKSRWDNLLKEVIIGTKYLQQALEAQRDMLISQRQVIHAERDQRKAVFELLKYAGLLNPRFLKLKVASFDPQPHYNITKERLY